VLAPRKGAAAVRRLRFDAPRGCGKRAAAGQVTFVASGAGGVPVPAPGLVRQTLRVGDDCVTALLGCKRRGARVVCRTQ
jgi:hypothetical protein